MDTEINASQGYYSGANSNSHHIPDSNMTTANGHANEHTNDPASNGNSTPHQPYRDLEDSKDSNNSSTNHGANLQRYPNPNSFANNNQSPQNSFQHRQLAADSGFSSPIPAGPSAAATPSHSQSHSQTSQDELYTATYSGIPVFEMMVNGVAVMRRRHDSCLNATQILKVAGVEKSKRTKVLEKEILTGEHEKVQGGYGKYQGTWIPFERGVSLCKQYSVYEMLVPLLQFDPADQMENTPTKEQALAAKRKRSTLTGSTSASIARNNSIASFTHPLQVTSSHAATPLSSNANAALSTLGRVATRQDTVVDDGGSENSGSTATANNNNNNNNNVNRGSSMTASSKRQRLMDYDLHNHNQQPLDENFPDIVEPLDPMDPNYVDMNLAHSVTRLFVAREDGDPVVLLNNMPEINRDSIDIPIDDSGHSALHWASALAMAPLVKELVRKGANQQRGNYAGETTLVRAVLVTNSFDVAIFPQLLESLYPAIPLIDKHGRTVLHHIALTAGIKGRSGASKYYLESLLEWIVRRGSAGKTKKYGLEAFMRDVVNVQDKNGDTALNIAARIGNKSISQQLLDVGANPHIANRAGLRPTDFGVLNSADSSSSGNNPSGSSYSAKEEIAAAAAAVGPQATSGNNNTNSSGSGLNNTTAEAAEEKRRQTIEAMTKMVVELDEEFDEELANKQKQIDSMHAQLRDTTTTLTQRRERLDELKHLSNKLVECQRSSANLERAIEEEDSGFKQATGGVINAGFDGDFDADQPFRIASEHEEIDAASIPPAVVLRARINAYRRNQTALQNLGQTLKSRSSALEQKFRKVVSLCTGVEEDRVDPLLEGLVQAVQSDRDDMDIERVAGFLRKIDRAHNGGVVV